MIQQTGYHYPHIMKLIHRGTTSLSSGFEDYSNTKPESKYSTKGITYVAFYSGKFEQGIGKTATILISAPKSNKKILIFLLYVHGVITECVNTGLLTGANRTIELRYIMKRMEQYIGSKCH